MKRWLWLVTILLPLAGSGQDLPGSRDHPVLGRIPGATIIGFEHTAYGTLRFPKATEGYHIVRTGEASGENWRIVYRLPKSYGPAAAQEIYRRRLKELGLEELFTCRNQGVLFYSELLEKLKEPGWTHGNPPEEIYCLVAQGEFHGRRATVTLYAYKRLFFKPQAEWGPAMRLYVIEEKPLEVQLQVVGAEEISRQIEQEGHIALYGIRFDFDSDRLRPESQAAISEVAQFLKSHPEVKLFVVGHTDNVGSYSYNLDLSRRRAAAVVRALVQDHGIRPERLFPVGIGPVAPVASNTTEEGRAKNRRVELVRQ